MESKGTVATAQDRICVDSSASPAQTLAVPTVPGDAGTAEIPEPVQGAPSRRDNRGLSCGPLSVCSAEEPGVCRAAKGVEAHSLVRVSSTYIIELHPTLGLRVKERREYATAETSQFVSPLISEQRHPSLSQLSAWNGQTGLDVTSVKAPGNADEHQDAPGEEHADAAGVIKRRTKEVARMDWLEQYITKDALQTQQYVTQRRLQKPVFAHSSHSDSLRDGCADRAPSVRSRATSVMEPAAPGDTSAYSEPSTAVPTPSQWRSIDPTSDSGGAVPSLTHPSRVRQLSGKRDEAERLRNPAVGENELAEIEKRESQPYVKLVYLEHLKIGILSMFYIIPPDEDYADARTEKDIVAKRGVAPPLVKLLTGAAIPLLYVIAVAFDCNDPARLRLALPTMRDCLQYVRQVVHNPPIMVPFASYGSTSQGRAGNASHTSEPSSRRTSTHGTLSPVTSIGILDMYDEILAANGNYCGPEYIDVPFEWSKKLSSVIVPCLNNYAQAYTLRQALTLSNTLFTQEAIPHLGHLTAVVSAVLEHHCSILRASSEEMVVQWLRTVAWFIPDERLAFSSLACRKRRQLLPDLGLQGTTATVKEILPLVPYFRHPPVVIDVSRRLDDPVHFFPHVTQLHFNEYRDQLFAGAKAADFPYSHVPVSPKPSVLVAEVCFRVVSILIAKQKLNASSHAAEPPAVLAADGCVLGTTSRTQSGKAPSVGPSPPVSMSFTSPAHSLNSFLRMADAQASPSNRLSVNRSNGDLCEKLESIRSAEKCVSLLGNNGTASPLNAVEGARPGGAAVVVACATQGSEVPAELEPLIPQNRVEGVKTAKVAASSLKAPEASAQAAAASDSPGPKNEDGIAKGGETVILAAEAATTSVSACSAVDNALEGLGKSNYMARQAHMNSLLLRNVALCLNQWRRQLLWRALAFSVAEAERNSVGSLIASPSAVVNQQHNAKLLKVSAADRRVMLAVIGLLEQLQQETEQRMRDTLVETFNF